MKAPLPIAAAASLLAGFLAGRRPDAPPPPMPGGGAPVSATHEAPEPRASVLTEAEAFFRNVDAAQLPELQAMWQEIVNDESASRFDYRLAAIVERHAELDPAGAVAFIVESTQKDILLRPAFAEWARQNTGAAIAALNDLDSSSRLDAARGIIDAAGGDPARILQCLAPLAAAIDDGHDSLYLRYLISPAEFRQLLTTDPEKCRELAKEMPPWAQAGMQGAELALAAQTDPDAAVQAIAAMKPDPDQLDALYPQLADLADSSPEIAASILQELARVSGTKADLLSYSVHATVFGHLLKQDPERAGAFVRAVTDESTGGFLVYETILNKLPGDVRTALELGPVMPAYGYTIGMMLPPYPIDDPAEALAAARDAPPSTFRDSIVTDAILQWHRNDPDAAQAWLDALPPDGFRRIVQTGLESTDLPAGLASMEQLGIRLQDRPDDPDAVRSAGFAVRLAATTNPEAAAQSALRWPAGDARDAALARIASTWWGIEREDAMQWAQSLPDTSAGAAATAGMVKSWTRSEPIAASEWVAALEPGPVREAAVDSFSGALTERDPEAALIWAATLTDSDRRSTRLDEVARHWLKTAPDAAQETIDSLPSLSPDDRARLQSLIPP